MIDFLLIGILSQNHIMRTKTKGCAEIIIAVIPVSKNCNAQVTAPFPRDKNKIPAIAECFTSDKLGISPLSNSANNANINNDAITNLDPAIINGGISSTANATHK